MYLIKRIYNNLFFIIAFILILGMGIYSYVKITSLNVQNYKTLKIVGESLLFVSIIFSIALVMFFYYLIKKNQSDVLDVLDKAKGHANQGNITRDSLSSLGKFGDKVFQINQELSELNDKRVERITSLSKEMSFIYNILEVPVIEVNMDGKIGKVSQGLLKKLNVEKESILDKYIKSVLEEVNFGSVSRELGSSTLVPVNSKLNPEFKEDEQVYYFIFYPIFDVKNKLSNTIAIIVTEEEYNNIKEHSELKEIPKKERTSPIINNLIDAQDHSLK